MTAVRWRLDLHTASDVPGEQLLPSEDSMSEPQAPTRAEDWLRKKDPGIRVIAAEMAEYAGRANLLWAQALHAMATDPDWSLARLIDLEILLDNLMQVEIDDILVVVREGKERLAAELPETDEDEAQDGATDGTSALTQTGTHPAQPDRRCRHRL
jgi:hypothetical protein